MMMLILRMDSNNHKFARKKAENFVADRNATHQKYIHVSVL